MTRILVTGAAGFVGTHVVGALLLSGAEVVAVDRIRPPHPAAAFIETDLLDPGSRRNAIEVARADQMLHLAWIAEPGVYWRSPLNLDWSAASLDLLRLFKDAGGRRAVLVGSCAEYEWSGETYHEDNSPCRPATLYGAAKDATRRLAMAYARETELSVAWARLFFIYGPGEKPGRLVSDAIDTLLADRPFAATAGLQKRDFLHVGDVAGALTSLLASHVTGAVNIGSGAAVPVRAILETLADKLDRRALLRLGEKPDAPGDSAIIQADVAKLSSEVGFRPRFDLDSGLADVIAAVRRNETECLESGNLTEA